MMASKKGWPCDGTPERFAYEFLIDHDKKNAAIRAGYSKKCAASIGNRVFATERAQKIIREALSRLQDRYQVGAENVLNEIAKVAFSNIKDICEWDMKSGIEIVDGVPSFVGRIRMRPSEIIPDHVSATIAEVAETKEGLKIKMHNKLEALNLLGKHLKLFSDINLVGDVTFNIEVTENELAPIDNNDNVALPSSEASASDVEDQSECIQPEVPTVPEL